MDTDEWEWSDHPTQWWIHRQQVATFVAQRGRVPSLQRATSSWERTLAQWVRVHNESFEWKVGGMREHPLCALVWEEWLRECPMLRDACARVWMEHVEQLVTFLRTHRHAPRLASRDRTESSPWVTEGEHRLAQWVQQQTCRESSEPGARLKQRVWETHVLPWWASTPDNAPKEGRAREEWPSYGLWETGLF
jgi:hypothetical protein